jgi:SAM-dependent methyltransferase
MPRHPPTSQNKKATSWEKVSEWYDEIVGKEGHFFHKTVIWPKLLPLLDLKDTPNPKLLDLGCGNGVFLGMLPKSVSYLGVDLSKSLIQQAKIREGADFLVADACKPINKKGFTHAVSILALQNMENPFLAIQNVAEALDSGGMFVMVLNHPCFRIPRQTHWGIDENQKLQYRRVDRYLTPLQIPIDPHPSKKNQNPTWSFHFPLEFFIKSLSKCGMYVVDLEEWTSLKKSTGRNAKMENRARDEIPLFLTIKSIKKHK